MIALCSADRAPDPTVLRSPGGFTWFYVDLVDDHGHGATLIWSWGLPFLPGYARAARTGRPELPVDRPSVNIVVYGPRGERFYLLSELPADQCKWGADDRSWRMGDNYFHWIDTPAPDGGAPIRTLHADLDLALPTGGRAVGQLRVAGRLRRDPPGSHLGDDPRRSHDWTPMIGASEGSLELSTPGGRLQVTGRAYHDRNSASEPLQRLGIGSWWWGRLALPGRDLVFYRLHPTEPGAAPRDLVVELGADGSCRARDDIALQGGPVRRSTWGLRWPSSVSFADPDGRPVRIDVDTLLDNGPFYQRYLLRGRCGDDQAYGIGENLVPSRVDIDLLRPLVRMRVHRAEGPNSMWLPLFCGDSDGRWRRMLGRAGRVRA